MEQQQLIVAPSVLSADFSDLAGAVKTIESSKADWVHLDVMDGHFVPNLTFGPKMVADLRPLTKLPFDVHLMIDNPAELVEDFAKAGADYITIHPEAVVHVHRLLTSIRDMGKRPGISIVPSTPVAAIAEVLPLVDLILIMTVNPGFGGQSLIPSCLDKVTELTELRRARKLDFLISVDGGINRSTVQTARKAGVDVVVSGSAFFGASNPALEVQAYKGPIAI